MNKKIVILCIISAVIITLPVLSPVVNSEYIENQSKIRVGINYYTARGIKKDTAELTYEEAEELKNLLILLNDAIERNDKQTIHKCECVLDEKGILGKAIKATPFVSTNLCSLTSDEITSQNFTKDLCYIHAVGEGVIFFNMGVSFGEWIIETVQNASSFIEAMVLMLALLPLFALIFLATHLIPFRIAMPQGIIQMENGSISTWDLSGRENFQVVNSSYQVNLTGFTGITINIPLPIGGEESENFLFISGMARHAEGQNDI